MSTITASTGATQPVPRAFLTARQLRFCEEYMADFNGKRAAVAAGYSEKTASSIACQLLDPDRFPLVAAKVKHLNSLKSLRCQLTVDELLKRLSAGVGFNPAQWFERGESRKGVPGWIMTEAQLRDLPDEIGGWIEEVEAREVVKDGVTVRRMWVRFASKVGLTQIVAKHLLGENISVNHTTTPLEELTKRVDATGSRVRALVEAPVPTPVEAKVDEPASAIRATASRSSIPLAPSAPRHGNQIQAGNHC